MYVCTYTCMFHHYYCITGALSITDDHCVSYTVTMVDVRSCIRPPRSRGQQHISEYPLKSIPPRLPDQQYISECTNISTWPKSFYSQSSTSVGEFYHCCVSCVLYI